MEQFSMTGDVLPRSAGVEACSLGQMSLTNLQMIGLVMHLLSSFMAITALCKSLQKQHFHVM